MKREETKKPMGVLRDLLYHYDCLGRVCHTQDASQQRIYFQNIVVNAENDYTYDAHGRLHLTIGREQFDPATNQLNPYKPKHSQDTIPGDCSQTNNYRETMSYGNGGNITDVKHKSIDGRVTRWSRAYQYKDASYLDRGHNQLTRRIVGRVEENYKYFKAGCAVLLSNVGYLR